MTTVAVFTDREARPAQANQQDEVSDLPMTLMAVLPVLYGRIPLHGRFSTKTTCGKERQIVRHRDLRICWKQVSGKQMPDTYTNGPCSGLHFKYVFKICEVQMGPDLHKASACSHCCEEGLCSAHYCYTLVHTDLLGIRLRILQPPHGPLQDALHHKQFYMLPMPWSPGMSITGNSRCSKCDCKAQTSRSCSNQPQI
jgi:hypothetical protein